MTSTRTSLVLAGAVVVAMAGTIAYLISTSPSYTPIADQRPRSSVSSTGRARSSTPVRRAPRDRSRIKFADAARDAAPGGLGERAGFAAQLTDRFQRRGRKLRAEATGEESRVFRITWPTDAPDPGHLEGLKRAEPYHRQARGLGFRRFELWVGDRQVWGKDL